MKNHHNIIGDFIVEKSLWQKYNKVNNINQVSENLNTDILIVGAGMTGVTTAYNFIDSNLDVILIDKGKFFNDTIAKSTGKITYLQDLKYQDICNIYDFDTAKLYYNAQKDAIKIIKKNIKVNNIDCDLEKTESITYTTNEKEVAKFNKEEEILNGFGVKFSKESKVFVDQNIKRLISVKDTYVFNPVKYLNGLLKKVKQSKNIKLYEDSVATKIKKEKGSYEVIVNGFKIKTKKLVIACGYPFFTIPGFIPLKTYLEKSYVTATKVDKNEKVNGITSNYPFVSFRYYEDKDNKYFIYLSNSSKISDKLNYKKNYDDVISDVRNITGKTPNYKWTNMDVMTNDFLPLIGRISADEKNAFIATGYNTWGMTNSTIAAKVISDLIRNKKSKYKEIFDPTRGMNIKKTKNFVVNTLSSNVKAYALNFIKKNPTWYKDKALVTKVNGKRVGIYYDEDGNKHIVSNICPHLKCFLTFNEIDKTWDCPCHGSRFDVEGNSIKGPSQYNIKIDEAKF